jgi:GT2 family glycosyltransferase
VREALQECLIALRGQGGGAPAGIWVVDNASTDGTAEMAAAEFPDVRLIPNRENVGFARGCNQALRQAAGDYLCLLNPDTRVCPGALTELVRFMKASPDAGAAGPALVNPDGSLQPNGGPFPTLAGTFFRATRLSSLFRGWYDTRFRWGRASFDQPARVDQVSGACLMIRKAALDAVGLLDERFFLYYEEVDWLLRARRAGWSAWYVPSARVVHRWGASTSQVSTAALRWLSESEYLYFAKHRPSWLRPLAWALTHAELLSHRVARAIRGRMNPHQPGR